MTTTRRQLREIGMEDRFESLIEEVGRVRAELGYPIMVTPFPQMVVSQALFNVIGERYANVPDQVIRYALGSFGRPTAPIEPDVLDRILDRPRAASCRPSRRRRRPRSCAGSSARRSATRSCCCGPTCPASRSTRCSPPARRRGTYNPALAPVLGLLRELGDRPTVHDLAIAKPDLRLSVHRRPEEAGHA